MAGYREFQTGEVLTSANVNDFLMNQAVMVFADSSARDTALGTAVGGSNALREGMLAYLDDTNEVLAYDGTAWGPVGLPIGTATPTDGQILTFGTATSTWNPTDQLAGIGSNVVQTVKTNTFSTSSTSFTAVTGLSVTITPSSASSKVLIIAQPTVAASGSGSNDSVYFRIAGGNAATYVGDANSSATRAIGGFYTDVGKNIQGIYAYSGVYLDSPATTSPVTYTLEVVTAQNTAYINRASTDSTTARHGRGASSLTAIEVAA